MDKLLIQHLWRGNKEEIIEKSLLNCHCLGMHSIMLLDSPGKIIRMYLTTENHEMYKNLPKNFHLEPMSIAFHPHHCDLTLVCVHGYFLNWGVKDSEPGFQTNKYVYRSKIKENEMSFIPRGKATLGTTALTLVKNGQSIYLPAQSIHTVGVKFGQKAAWLVLEGKKDPNYISYCYSNIDVNTLDFTNLYQKPTHDQMEKLLKDYNLI